MAAGRLKYPGLFGRMAWDFVAILISALLVLIIAYCSLVLWNLSVLGQLLLGIGIAVLVGGVIALLVARSSTLVAADVKNLSDATTAHKAAINQMLSEMTKSASDYNPLQIQTNQPGEWILDRLAVPQGFDQAMEVVFRDSERRLLWQDLQNHHETFFKRASQFTALGHEQHQRVEAYWKRYTGWLETAATAIVEDYEKSEFTFNLKLADGSTWTRAGQLAAEETGRTPGYLPKLPVRLDAVIQESWSRPAGSSAIDGFLGAITVRTGLVRRGPVVGTKVTDTSREESELFEVPKDVIEMVYAMKSGIPESERDEGHTLDSLQLDVEFSVNECLSRAARVTLKKHLEALDLRLKSDPNLEKLATIARHLEQESAALVMEAQKIQLTLLLPRMCDYLGGS